jgi:DNA-binding CsgD family transcriptional regulator
MGNRDADDLTQREREVLDLIRVGLTNEEIAERLGITLDGAKYHVSQILSKLGVATREEAAEARMPRARATGPRRRWWVALPLAAKAAGAALVVVAVAGLGVLAWGVWETGESDGGELSTCELTVEAVTECYAQATQRPNSVYHQIGVSQVRARIESGDVDSEGHIERWFDSAGNREKTVSYNVPDEDFRFESVTLAGTTYRVMTRDGERTNSSKFGGTECSETEMGLTYGVPCPESAVLSSSSRVEYGRDKGRLVVVLIQESTSETDGQVATHRSRLLLDPSSFLPIAGESTLEYDSGSIPDTEFTTRYENEFLDADALPDDFFDPASIGYVEEPATP